MRIAFDSHKRYTFCSVADDRGRVIMENRIEHERGALRRYLTQYPAGEKVAVEAMGSWYWIVDEIEAAGMEAQLVSAQKAKLMLGCANKTDRLDARGLNLLAQAGTLPTVWIPPGELRDQRDLTRTRMMLRRTETRFKARIHAALGRYALGLTEVSDIFAKGNRTSLRKQIQGLPEQTRYTTLVQLDYVDHLEGEIDRLEKRIKTVFGGSEALSLVQTMPGIGPVLGLVITLEVGDIGRFPSAAQYASYAGTTPRVHASGGKVRYGRLRSDVNHYLKWAYCEAANVVSRFRENWPERHVCQLYNRLRQNRGHAKAIGAVARHLAEATWWILTKEEAYCDPAVRLKTSTRV
jgi:transposase